MAGGAQPHLRPPIPASETPAHLLTQPRTLTKFLPGSYRNPRKRRVWGRRRGWRAPMGREVGLGGTVLGSTAAG